MTHRFFAIFLPFLLIIAGAHAHAAPSRANVEAFLQTTGFDVALDSIGQSAGAAPTMLGLEDDAFGTHWTQIADQVFASEKMREIAIELLQNTLSEELLDHGAAFYASDLGQRIVHAENASHMVEDDDAKSEAGEAIIAGLVRIGSARVEDFKRMTAAIGGADASVKAIQEIQLRFLMAAAGAGVIELGFDEQGLRNMLARQAPELRRSIQSSSLSGAAYTYQALSDRELADYAEALEHPMMRKVYELMNAVQYEVMANRFEALAKAMSNLRPSTDL